MVEETLWITRLAISAITLPFLSFLIVFLIQAKFEWVAPLLSSIFLLASTICSILVFSAVWNGEPITINLNWFVLNGVENIGQLKFDNLSALMMFLVCLISLLVHIYSAGYMTGSSGLKRYFAVLGFFTFSMLGLVASNHLLLTFIFWELVGFSSYLLIGHWREKSAAGAAATKAFIFNRIGDAGFLIGLGLLWANTNTLNIDLLKSIPIEQSLMTWISLGIFCGVIGKSAQFPLLTWLPDAMEGPTPVSALIHAATMVAAGIFVMARLYFLFTPMSLVIVGVIGSITALWGAWGALQEFDIKKILAYSTVSQLGFMILGMSSGSYTGSMLHLFTHAFFKAGLFLIAGVIIYYLDRVQLHSDKKFDTKDIRNMGGLRHYLPNAFFASLLAGASLMGLPFFSGFLSKDALLTQLFNSATQTNQAPGWILLVIAFIVSFLTVLYTFRFLSFIFFGENRLPQQMSQAKSETVPFILILPIAILSLASIWMIVSINPFHFSGWVSTGLNGKQAPNLILTIISILWIFIALATAYLIFRKKTLHTSDKYFFNLDNLYTIGIEKPVKQLALLSLAVDKKWIDRSLHFTAYASVMFSHFITWCDRFIVDQFVNGAAKLARRVGSITRSFSAGKIQSYILWAMTALIIFIIWILLY
jgi:NADH-quinone oxidoreductase subunit L